MFEFVGGGLLREHLLDSAKAAQLTPKRRLAIAIGIAKALDYLHSGAAGWRGGLANRNLLSKIIVRALVMSIDFST